MSKIVEKSNEIKGKISKQIIKNDESIGKTSITDKNKSSSRIKLTKKSLINKNKLNKIDKSLKNYLPNIALDKKRRKMLEDNLKSSKDSSTTFNDNELNQFIISRKMFRLIDLPNIIELRSELILQPFKILFQQFPKKMKKLQTMMADENDLNPNRMDILTNLNQFHIPPALNSITNEKSLNDNCNFNHQYPIYITYDGYIQSNHSINNLIRTLEQHCSFYLQWVNSFFRALNLFRPPLMLIGNCEMDVQDFCLEFIENINDQVKGW